MPNPDEPFHPSGLSKNPDDYFIPNDPRRMFDATKYPSIPANEYAERLLKAEQEIVSLKERLEKLEKAEEVKSRLKIMGLEFLGEKHEVDFKNCR